MSTAAKFLEQISAAGISIAAEGSALSFTPASRLTAEQRTFIREHKAGILAELRAVRSSEAVLEPCQPGDDIPPSNDAIGELTDTERGTLIAMGMRWRYTPADWDRLWSDCQDPAKRQAWLDTARMEQPRAPEQEDAEPTITVRIEADIGAGRKRFDLAIPAHRWDELKFSEQIAAMPGARWWRLDQPKRCADCRHAQATSHVALVTCGAGREDYPSCGAFWDTDERMCREWAPIRTSTRGQIQEHSKC